ncbi:hypothetical protein [Ensifer adhaerens]|nr:hypothetical protein [Ensifer adhaerens]
MRIATRLALIAIVAVLSGGTANASVSVNFVRPETSGIPISAASASAIG